MAEPRSTPCPVVGPSVPVEADGSELVTLARGLDACRRLGIAVPAGAVGACVQLEARRFQPGAGHGRAGPRLGGSSVSRRTWPLQPSPGPDGRPARRHTEASTGTGPGPNPDTAPGSMPAGTRRGSAHAVLSGPCQVLFLVF